MADLSDVLTALVAQIVSAVYPNGTSSASESGAPTYVYPGMPVATTLDADMMAMFNAIQAGNGPTAGRVHVSVYTGNVEQNQTRSLDGWQNIGTANSGVQSTAKEIRRVKRQFIITVYAPTPALRDISGALIDVALCSLRNLPLGDGSAAQIYYGTTVLDDMPSKEYMFQRKGLYFVEYGTFITEEATLVKEVVANVDGGYDPANVIKQVTVGSIT